MSITLLIANYGYLAIFIGSILEGETVLILGGYAVQQGFLSFYLVILIGFIGGLLGDQTYFFIGRKYGQKLINKYQFLQNKSVIANKFLHKHGNSTVIIMRFLYGLRIALPIIIGTSHYPIIKFLFFNMIGAAIWAILITSIGYFFGQFITTILGDLHKYELITISSLIIIALIFHQLIRKFFNKSQ